jgi:hypothetical protein
MQTYSSSYITKSSAIMNTMCGRWCCCEDLIPQQCCQPSMMNNTTVTAILNSILPSCNSRSVCTGHGHKLLKHIARYSDPLKSCFNNEELCITVHTLIYGSPIFLTITVLTITDLLVFPMQKHVRNTHAVVLVRDGTVPTKRQLLAGEVSANFC